MVKSRLPHSIRKFLRREKSRIRREILNAEEAEKRIKDLAAKIQERYTHRAIGGKSQMKEERFDERHGKSGN